MNAAREAIKDILLGVPARTEAAHFYGRVLAFTFFAVWGLRLVFAPMSEAADSVMHYVNLPMHEAGHVIFGFLGDFMRTAGGTLMQLLMPAIAAGALLIQNGDAFGASIASWWLAQNFMDIAPYINDARAGQLMLLGGVTGKDAPEGFHDWENILGRLGWLDYDHVLALLSFYLGALLMLASLAWGGYILYLQFNNLERD